MKRCLLVLFILFVTACSHAPEYPLPDPPYFATVSGQRCAIQCRQEDYDCKMDCRGTKSEQIECVSECNQGLDQCYQLCTVVFKL
jgi:hypothetical protein